MYKRACQKELLDDPSMSFEEIQLNMKELNTINSLLGGHAITLSGLRKIVSDRKDSSISVMEIGCGGGDNLKALWTWAIKGNSSIQFSGVDINPACISFAKQVFPEANYLHADYRQLIFDKQPDILFSSLFCHHFTDEELVEQLRWMYRHCKLGFFINDLHRHWVAYHSIRLLTAVFSRSRLVKNDAPLSVKRGFRRADWIRLLQYAGIPDAEIQWRWAFRWLIVVKKPHHD